MTAFPAHYVDGITATRHQVQVTLTASGLLIAGPEGGPVATWAYHEMTVVPDERADGPIRLAQGRARLAVEDPGFADALYTAAPKLKPTPSSQRLINAALAIAASIALVAAIWRSLPFATQAAVGLVPTALEERLGDQRLASFDLPQCQEAAGQAALDTLVQRLTAHATLPFHARVVVADWNVVNAFALPGGRIVLLRGLLNQAKSADEVAGALAHELTHTLKRHPMRHLVAQAGIDVLVEVMLGYNTSTGNVGAFMASLTYSRAEEAEADAGAIELLRGAGISTSGFADFFDRLSHDPEQAIPPYLSNHPAPGDRLAAVRAAGATGTTPALAPAQWRSLQHICDGTRAKADGRPPAESKSSRA